MKKVVKGNTEQVMVNSVSKNKYYGVKQLSSKGFIVREDYDKGNYKAYCANKLTNGNAWWIEKPTDSFVKFVDELVEKKYEVFEFDTSQELFKWLSE